MNPIERHPAYLVGGRRVDAGTPEFAEAIAAAHSARQRPRCLCLVGGIEMYVARLAGLGGGYIVKRMPDTGSHHAPDCPSYEPPAEFSGLGQVIGSAIAEDPATGVTTLKLGFAMSKLAGRSTMPAGDAEGDSVASTATRLSLRGLLHYLWEQAELTRWQPGFVGKRSWATVRKHLLHAAENKSAHGDSLRARLCIPEMFSVEQRDAILARRAAQWSKITPAPGKPQQLMLLIAEVKELVPARYGFKAVVKQMPDQAFLLDEPLYRRLGRRFEPELTLWGASDDIHMLMIATFNVSSTGIPSIAELSLMPVTRQWLPVESEFEKQLIERLVGDARSFVKGLRYNLGPACTMGCATLTDCGDKAPVLFVATARGNDKGRQFPGDHASSPTWWWQPSSEPMPSLPPRRASSHSMTEDAVKS